MDAADGLALFTKFVTARHKLASEFEFGPGQLAFDQRFEATGHIRAEFAIKSVMMLDLAV